MIFSKDLRNVVKDLYASVNTIEHKISNIQFGVEVPDTVDCEVCGCRVRKEYAKQGKSEVRTRRGYLHFAWQNIEFIYTPFFCKRCAPEDKK